MLLPVERVLAGGEPRYSAEDIAEQTGLDREFLERLWRALGMAIGDPDERRFSDADLEAAERVKSLREAGLPDDAIVEIGRVMSRGMFSVASTIRRVFAETYLRAGDDEQSLALRYAEASRELTPLLGPVLEHILGVQQRSLIRQAAVDGTALQTGRPAPERGGHVLLRGPRGLHQARRERRHRRARRRGRAPGGDGDGGGRAAGAPDQDDRRRGDAPVRGHRGAARRRPGARGPRRRRGRGLPPDPGGRGARRGARALRRLVRAPGEPGQPDHRHRAAGLGARRRHHEGGDRERPLPLLLRRQAAHQGHRRRGRAAPRAPATSPATRTSARPALTRARGRRGPPPRAGRRRGRCAPT